MDFALPNTTVAILEVTVDHIDRDFITFKNNEGQKISWPLPNISTSLEVGDRVILELKKNKLEGIQKIITKAKNESTTKDVEGMRKLLESLIN